MKTGVLISPLAVWMIPALAWVVVDLDISLNSS
jgi:hypothetical protein